MTPGDWYYNQLYALQRAMAGDRVRYLLADEVGLGKTIEAGLILREQKVRGLVRRILVVAPAGLTSQWVSEMKTHFSENFRLVQPGNFQAWRQVARVDETENLWRLDDQVVCPLDSIKPMDARRGWSREQVARYNRERFEDLVSAGWDLIIVDEAHRLGGSSEQVARYRLGEALAQASPYLLLLSATPHQGKTDAFRRLVGFLDADALPDDESVTRDNVAPYVIRTEKRCAIDAEGKPLFRPRYTQIVSVAWEAARQEQRALYEAVTEYVREGYNQAVRDKRTAIGFLMILMQRLVTSSTTAIRTALERRLKVLELPSGQLSWFPTQTMLADFLGQRGYRVACLNGSMDLDARKSVQRAFAGEAQVLISTDAGGEGLNLQFCHVIVNYDLPWNPMKIEQRIGRVDRIGQKHIVRALNFALEDTVELRVREVLEEKLQRILEEFGVDKLSDVLDSEEGGLNFERLYVEAVLSPEEAEARAEALADSIRARARSARQGASVLSTTEALDPSAAQKVAGHQMPYWTERMTVSWLQNQATRGARVRLRSPGVYDLTWPDGREIASASFARSAADDPGKTLLTIEDHNVRGLTMRIPPYAPGLPVARIVVPGVSDKVSGFWSLWRIGLSTFDGREQRAMPIFVTGEGQALGPTARAVWDRIVELGDGLELLAAPASTGERIDCAFEQARAAAEQQGKTVFNELIQRHRERIGQETRKMTNAFAARRRAIERLGLPEVRGFRLAQLAQEEAGWRRDLAQREHGLPDLTPLLLVAVARTGDAP